MKGGGGRRQRNRQETSSDDWDFQNKMSVLDTVKEKKKTKKTHIADFTKRTQATRTDAAAAAH